MMARIPDTPTANLTLSDANIGELSLLIVTTTLNEYITDGNNEYGAISKNLESAETDTMPGTGVTPAYRVHTYVKEVLFCSFPSQLVNNVDAKNVTLFHLKVNDDDPYIRTDSEEVDKAGWTNTETVAVDDCNKKFRTYKLT